LRATNCKNDNTKEKSVICKRYHTYAPKAAGLPHHSSPKPKLSLA